MLVHFPNMETYLPMEVMARRRQSRKLSWGRWRRKWVGGGYGAGGGECEVTGGGAGWAGSGLGSSIGGESKWTFNGVQVEVVGGFGGGGGQSWGGGAGGGGGYSGGGGSGWSGGSPNSNAPGGGGGSYNAGTNQDNQSGVNEGHGKVIISFIGN